MQTENRISVLRQIPRAVWVLGCVSLFSGVVTLASSIIAGTLWDHLGAATTFHAGAGFCVLTVAVLLFGPTPDTTAGR